MKIITRTIICIIAAVSALTSCKQDDTLQYNNITMGNVVNGTFTSDQGNIFNVVEKNCNGNFEDIKRAIVACDVLKKVEGTDNVYDIRLNDMAEVLTKSPITTEVADSDETTAVKDPICIDDLWISGGYINMFAIIEIKSTGGVQKHLVNLVLDEKESGNGKYVFTLRHNSFGESVTHDASGISLAGNYVSFPITEIIKEDSAEIVIKWRWYKNAGDGWSNETQENSYNISYTKGGYEHVPTVLTSKTTDMIN